MIKLRTTAPAKINLTLDVLDRRPDGYHNLSTIMHQVPLEDEIEVMIGQGEGIRATTNLPFIRAETNIAAKAARLFIDELGKLVRISEKNTGILIDIRKRIPVGAGLGGGSANAAAVLKLLNEYFGSPFDEKSLVDIGARVGADVPFCLIGGCALCEGIGEIMTPLARIPSCYIVIVKPRASISTAQLFSEYTVAKSQVRPDTAGAVNALKAGDLCGISSRVFNVLEEVAVKKIKGISEIKRVLMRNGALGASMSGSGSAVFGIFDDKGAADSAASFFEKSHSQVFMLRCE
ncbi:MAG: 4-(cytidine 5'-diphospho)-2-C-methyl-D-erythritol kinase [Clostridiales bacterium]|nr:4-(cytidine 5'-diphospho)-2-C-methyl-D-erythritol kinase [Clostridiales bacterium]